jgi:hypothetical protein
MGKTVAIIVFSCIAGFWLLLWFMNRRASRDFQTLVAERGFRLRSDCPVAEPFGPGVISGGALCYDGELQPGVPMTLMFGSRRTGSVNVQGAALATQEALMAIYLPPAVPLSEPWLLAWQAKVTAKQGRFPVLHAGRTAQSGMLLVWFGANQRQLVEDRMREVIATLPAR